MTTERAFPSLPAALDAAQRLLTYLDERSQSFPSTARTGLGRRLLDAAVDFMHELASAHYAKARSATRIDALDRANAQLALLRLLRSCHDRRYLSSGQRDHAARLLADAGRALGGWRKRESAAFPNHEQS